MEKVQLSGVGAAIMSTAQDLRSQIEAMGIRVYEADAVHLRNSTIIDMNGPIEKYAPLLTNGSADFLSWLKGPSVMLESGEVDGEVAGFIIAVRVGHSQTWLRIQMDPPEPDDDLDPDDDDDGDILPQFVPADPALMDAWVMMIATAPGFGQLRSNAQREEFAAGVLADVTDIRPADIAVAASRSEPTFTFEVLPAQVKAMKADGKSVAQIAAKLGVSKQKVERALVADSPKLPAPAKEKRQAGDGWPFLG